MHAVCPRNQIATAGNWAFCGLCARTDLRGLWSVAVCVRACMMGELLGGRLRGVSESGPTGLNRRRWKLTWSPGAPSLSLQDCRKALPLKGPTHSSAPPP